MRRIMLLSVLLCTVLGLYGCDTVTKKPYEISGYSLGIDYDRAVFQLTYKNNGKDDIRMRANDGTFLDVVVKDAGGSIVYDSRELASNTGLGLEDVVVVGGEKKEFLYEVPLRYLDVATYSVDLLFSTDVPKEDHVVTIDKFEVTDKDLVLKGKSDSPYEDTRDRGTFIFSGVVDSHSVEVQDETGDYLVMGVVDELRELYSRVESGLVIEFDFEDQGGRFVIVSDYVIAD